MKIRTNDLRVRPLDNYETPRYPTLAVHNCDPSFTIRHIPQGWAGKSLTLGLLATFALSAPMALASDGSSRSAPPPVPSDPQASNLPEPGKSIVERASVAPVFIHGDGRGATGCVVIGAPVFLSENEAMEIVLAELQRAGLSFDDRDHLVPGMEWDEPLLRTGFFAARHRPAPSAKKPYTVELYDTHNQLAVKIITAGNYHLSGGAFDGSSVADWDLLALAQKTVERLQASATVNAVVFYDPLQHGGSFGDDRENGIARAREQLRAQVHDFLGWLKSRKIVQQPED